MANISRLRQNPDTQTSVVPSVEIEETEGWNRKTRLLLDEHLMNSRCHIDGTGVAFEMK